ncbi:uncharacterized protein [Typha latifolia]|uniref:uncharacterized protein n=1 Tax=Typha latifolia TaxID=4733 RepID=UPI003C2B0A29
MALDACDPSPLGGIGVGEKHNCENDFVPSLDASNSTRYFTQPLRAEVVNVGGIDVRLGSLVGKTCFSNVASPMATNEELLHKFSDILKGEDMEENIPMQLENVVPSCNPSLSMIGKLLSGRPINAGAIPICYLRDFNQISSAAEKEGGNTSDGVRIKALNDWINNSDLHDLGFAGPAYTWSNQRGACRLIREKLDRGLANSAWFLKIAWNGLSYSNRPTLVKLSSLASQIKHWAKNSASSLQNDIKKVKECIANIQAKPAISEEDQVSEQILRSEHDDLMLKDEQFWHQRAQVCWLQCGDRNNHFFHATTTSRSKRKHIELLQLEDDILTHDSCQIRVAFVSYFRNLFKPTSPSSILDCELTNMHLGPRILKSEGELLVAPPSDEDITATLKNLVPDCASGPDRLNAKFMQNLWPCFKNDICSTVRKFFTDSEMDRGLNKTVIALILKKDQAMKIGDFWLISLCNTIYKVISKLVAARIKPYLNYIISKTQNAFTLGR